MPMRSKRARRKIRSSSEFDRARLEAAVATPYRMAAAHSWNLDEIRAARDAQMRGNFALPARLAASMRTDDALFVAFENRLAPQRAVAVALRSAGTARGEAVAKEGESLFGQAGVGIHPDTLSDIHGCLVNHGVAFGRNSYTWRPDGSRVDVELLAHPIEYVRWDAVRERFVSQMNGGVEEIIEHGDGRWVVFQRATIDPWNRGCLLPAALVWARHAFGMRDWAQGSVAHGNAKVIGEMPAGVALQDDDTGALTPEAGAFLDLLNAIASGDVPVGIRPAGSKTEYLANASTAWQVWSELALSAEKAAARIYLGTDGTLGATGGAPGVDITALFGVASTLVEGDLQALERALLTGTIEPWTAINFGDSSLAPRRVYLLPDGDADARRESLSKRYGFLFDALDRAKALGLSVDVGELAVAYGVTPPRVAPPG